MHSDGCNYLSMLGLKLNHVSKRGHWCSRTTNKAVSLMPNRSNRSNAGLFCTNRDLDSLISARNSCSKFIMFILVMDWKHRDGPARVVSSAWLQWFNIFKRWLKMYRVCWTTTDCTIFEIHYLKRGVYIARDWLCRNARSIKMNISNGRNCPIFHCNKTTWLLCCFDVTTTHQQWQPTNKLH